MGTTTRKSSGGGNTNMPGAGEVPLWAQPLVRGSDVVAPWMLLIALLTFIILLASLFFGKTSADYHSLNDVISLFVFFSVMGGAALLAGRYKTFIPGWLGAFLGAGFLFGGNIVLSILADRGGIKSGDPYLKLLYEAMPNVGVSLLALSIVRLAIGFGIKFLTERGVRATNKFRYMDTTAITSEKPGYIPQCWQMSRCRPGVRMSCPNYLERVTCWKRRSGCFCDRNLANYLVSASDRGSVSEVDDMQRNIAAVSKGQAGQGAIMGHMKNATRRPWKEQKKLCHACPLYCEHQEYKYRSLHWLSFPITIVLIVVIYPLFHVGYDMGAGKLDNFMQYLMSMKKLPENFKPDASTLVGSPFEYVLLAMVGLWLASYVVAFIDRVFLEWKL